MALKPRVYGTGNVYSMRQEGLENSDAIGPAVRVQSQLASAPYTETGDMGRMEEEIERMMARPSGQKPASDLTGDNDPRYHGTSSLMTDQGLLRKNRTELNRFEPLKIGQNVLTGYTIGGFRMDLDKVSEKAREVVPLPPAQLPIIFADDSLNFHHHFFQGLNSVLDRDVIQDIVTREKYSDAIDGQFMEAVISIMKEGYKAEESEVALFTKRVLTSTFDISKVEESNQFGGLLTVAANLWGFQYIEAGMKLRDPDLKMWIKICWGHYKTLWFNTFKSAGVPSFAFDGVQQRYGSKNIIGSGNYVAPAGQGSAERYAVSAPLGQRQSEGGNRLVLMEREEYHEPRAFKKSYSCPSCELVLTTAVDLKRHINSVHDREQIYHCKVEGCKRSAAQDGGYPRKDNLERHYKTKHNTRWF